MTFENRTSAPEIELANKPHQKIRTIELDGKTVKLQIVCITVTLFLFANTNVSASGIPQVKSDFEQSHPPTTAEHMASVLSTM